MMADPVVSIVVPTCGRPSSLQRLLAALAAHSAHGSTDPFEVIIVADGVCAGSAHHPGAGAWPFSVSVHEQPALGAAAARNRGAALARAPILLFLDDDVEPRADLVGAHVRFHRDRPDAIGAGALAPVPSATGFVGSSLAGWWDVMCDGLADPRHRFTFRDLLTGHCSVGRSAFEALGGFDTSLRCHEDFDFGVRAIAAGVDIRFVPGSDACHHDASTLDKILARKFAEGVADVQFVAKHPSLLGALPLGRTLAEAPLARAVYGIAIASPSAASAVLLLLRGAMALFEQLSMRDKWRSALERAMDVAYWRGAAAHAGGAAAIRALRATVAPDTTERLDVDLSGGLDSAEALIDGTRPAALRVRVGPHPVGELRPVPGAEPVRGLHLRPLLLKEFAAPLAVAYARAGILPDVFNAAAGADTALDQADAGVQRGCAA